MPAAPTHRLSCKTKVQTLPRGSAYAHLLNPKLRGEKRRKALQRLYVLKNRGQLELPVSDAKAQAVAPGRVVQSAEAVAIPCGDLGNGGYASAQCELLSDSDGGETAEYTRSDDAGHSSDEREDESTEERREVSVQTDLTIPMNVQIFGLSGLQGAGPGC